MNRPPDDLVKKLLFILHQGFVEGRNLALQAGHEQIADLCDAMEILPGLIENWQDEHLDLVTFVLKNYRDKYPGRNFDYLAELEKYPVPERF
jgi:hypothetical protein